MPEDVVTSIHMFLDSQQPVFVDDAAIDARQAMFIFTTNEGHTVMRSETARLLRHRDRQDLRHRDFEPLLQAIITEANPWLAHKGVVHLYAPFLPMTRVEVREFIVSRFKEYACQFRVDLTHDDDVMSFLIGEIGFDANGFTEHGLARIDEPTLLTEVKGPLQDLIEDYNNRLVKPTAIHMSMDKNNKHRVAFDVKSTLHSDSHKTQHQQQHQHQHSKADL
ncbi:hypothetical protein PTSG_05195 [Salpingoeca rosetta]|uniref:Clp ATPase C-terminal domain-containing protein n=1 Tax=Salpingoeca rosetta (strain ATCC 50818 / BSB-021) TaxID=946362 RepID=F2UAS5_SALR5|nr:uncharacterized protein PTSG_05195 [Salpingoeca rosetta]EGD73491.1 hypothetical protein PTSG_05195 [Salpingoeca rosetta]|eukprot:XP_004993773.1 hypothetical protein PTSG_05195 [Salpingoeca rosetta]